MSGELKDARLEAAARIQMAVFEHCAEEDRCSIEEIRERVSNPENIQHAQSYALVDAAIRETHAGYLAEVLHDLAEAFVNPGDGAPFEDGEVPVLDAARAAIAKYRTLTDGRQSKP